jgi:thiamine-phosphate pyrophosphorylase
MLQLRDKQLPDAELLELARRVRTWTRDAGVLFIMNDRPDLALLADADGVHVGQDELDVRSVRRIVGSSRLVGVSTHSLQQARQAVLDGADYLGVGPVFPSTTQSFDQLAGLDFVRAVAQDITLPWFAIGGISVDNIHQVTAAGATRVAVSAAVARTDDPCQAARELKQYLIDLK